MSSHPQQEVVEYPIPPSALAELKSLLTTVIPTDIADPQEIQQAIIKIIETGWNFDNLHSNLYERMVASSVKTTLIQVYGNEGLSGLLTTLIERLTIIWADIPNSPSATVIPILMKIRDGQKLNQQDVAVIKMTSLFISFITSPPPQDVAKDSPDDEKSTTKTPITAEAKQQPTSYQLDDGQQAFLIMVDLWSSWGGEEVLEPLVNDKNQTTLNNLIEEAYSNIVSPLQKTLATIQDLEIITALHALQKSNSAKNISAFFGTIKLHIDKESKREKNTDMEKAAKAIETFKEKSETCTLVLEGLRCNNILLVNLKNKVEAYIQIEQAKELSLKAGTQQTTEFSLVESKPETKSQIPEGKKDAKLVVEAHSSIKRPTTLALEEEEEENDDDEEAQAIALSLRGNPSVPGNNSPKGDSKLIGQANLFPSIPPPPASLSSSSNNNSQSSSVTPGGTPTPTSPSSDPPLEPQMGGPASH